MMMIMMMIMMNEAISYRFPLAVECSCAPKFPTTLPQKYLTRSTFFRTFFSFLEIFFGDKINFLIFKLTSKGAFPELDVRLNPQTGTSPTTLISGSTSIMMSRMRLIMMTTMVMMTMVTTTMGTWRAPPFSETDAW